MSDQLVEVIYSVYPRRVGRPAGVKAIKKAIKAVQKEKDMNLLEAGAYLIGATKEYASRVAGKEKKYIPFPQKWFNEERYNDDPDEWGPRAVGWKPSYELPSKEWVRENWGEYIEPEFRVRYDPDLEWNDYPSSIQSELLHIWSKTRS